MKKLMVIIFSAFIGINAGYAQFGGFSGPRAPSVKTMTVSEALKMRDDSIVVLNGHIINSLGDEKYLFRDATGDVIIEIDNDEWHGVNVTPEDLLEIVGKIDKEFFEATKIDVKSFTIK